jgi:CRISPR-associated endonuclease/helicase Cas3
VESAFDAFFKRCSGEHPPYEYQRAVAERLFGGAHLEVWAPTGAGKTLAVLAPFLWQFERAEKPRWDRLIYVLPLRSLVESIAAETRRIVDSLGLQGVEVTVQTGENPGDAFFAEGRVILTTYDQLLSGALEGPYGLPDMLHNINSAAVAGALVVFDEYHLMQPDQAFLTAVAHIHQYRDMCQSVWMTATATLPLRTMLGAALSAERIDVDPDELARMPAVAQVERRVTVQLEPLTATAILEHHQDRSIALVNTVARANVLYDELKTLSPSASVRLLHSQFIPRDRQTIEADVRRIFGQGSSDCCILVSTQVIEAGMNISAEVLHTEAAPMSALVQRAGRCARFPREVGDVLVYPLPETDGKWWLPYDQQDIEHSLAALADLSDDPILDSSTMRALVDVAHAKTDGELLRPGWLSRQSEITRRARSSVVLRKTATVSDLIRVNDGQTIRTVVAYDPVSRRLNPYAVEGFGLRRGRLYQLFVSPPPCVGWRWAPNADPEWVPLTNRDDLKQAFAVCLHPDVASYTPTGGLRLGARGTFESPRRPPVETQDHRPAASRVLGATFARSRQGGRAEGGSRWHGIPDGSSSRSLERVDGAACRDGASDRAAARRWKAASRLASVGGACAT